MDLRDGARGPAFLRASCPGRPLWVHVNPFFFFLSFFLSFFVSLFLSFKCFLNFFVFIVYFFERQSASEGGAEREGDA